MAKILTSGATEILKKLSFVVSKEIRLAWGVEDDLKKLQRTLQMILGVIADAEKRQDKEEAVRVWLARLKSIAYDADDVMDEFSYESMRRCERGSRLKHKVLDFVSSSSPLAFRFKMAKKIKHINGSLDEVTKDMVRFQLQITRPVDKPIINGESSEQRDRKTTSLSSEPNIVGRENDKNKIINMLTKVTPSTSSDRNPEKITTISLVGMGGLGKTTLAQLVYNDELLISRQFETKMWVYVSENFDLEIILVKIMESITNTKFDTGSNLDVLVNKVREELNGKKYLLVLDDLWNEDAEQWDKLRAVLLVGAQGSKILITTRKNQVASIVRGSIPPYNLGQLPDDACWSMIEQKGFSPGGAINTQIMTNIGKQIAEKCCGLPLAAKFLGGLLHSKNGESDWISIRDDDIWNTTESKTKILPVLKISYNNLPSHLKQCFSYCSIFPKNWEISKETLVQLWMAEGFLQQSDAKNKRSTEDFGRDYFESLAWSSFFQDFKKNVLGDIEKCKMHDLVHDLAKDVFGKNELVSLKVSEFADVSEVRRLQLDLDEDISATFLKSLNDAKKLRTILLLQGTKLDPLIFSRNKHLRVLHVDQSPDPSFLKLHHLSFKLKHLRYLRLTYLDLSEVVYDQSINKLYNLETLVLSAIDTGVQNLLANIHSLKKLRYLEISWTHMVELSDSFTSLCNLQTLDLHNCELKVIHNSISGLRNLRFLNLSFNPIEELPGFIITLSNLETLDVNSCKKLKSLPEYVAGLANLRIFNFRACPLLEALPEDFGALTQLRSLDLDGTGIKVLPKSCSNLHNLEYARLRCCEHIAEVNNWTKLRKIYFDPNRCPPMGIEKLVRLQELVYRVPAKITDESECSDGIEVLASLNLLEILHICALQNVKCRIDAETANLKGKHNLFSLLLHWDWIHWDEIEEELGTTRWDDKVCNDLQVCEALRPSPGLRQLVIDNFMGWQLPRWMCVPSCLPDLLWLELANCRGITHLPEAIGKIPRLAYLTLSEMFLKSLRIGGFPSLYSLELTDMFLLEEVWYSYPCLQDLRIIGCKRLTEIPLFPSLRLLELKKVDHKLVYSVGRSQTSLTTLYLENINGLVYFPMSILQNNSNLQVLQIKGCNQFQGFGGNDDENENHSSTFHIGSVGQLHLLDCPVLKLLPDFQRSMYLWKLTIFNCPQVEEFLTYDLKSLSFLLYLFVDFIERAEQRGDPSVPEDLINLMK